MKSILIAITLLVSGLAYGQTADAYYNRGLTKSKLEDDRGAIADYSIAIELNPNEANFYFNRGIVRMLFDEKDEYCMDFSKAGELGLVYAYDMIKAFFN